MTRTAAASGRRESDEVHHLIGQAVHEHLETQERASQRVSRYRRVCSSVVVVAVVVVDNPDDKRCQRFIDAAARINLMSLMSLRGEKPREHHSYQTEMKD